METNLSPVPNPCPPHQPGSSGPWKNRCVKCGSPC